MKTNLHLVAGEPILNTDGENYHHGYDQLAKENITTESTDVYSIAHPFGADETTQHAWIRGFYEAPKEAGLTVSVEFTAEMFFIRELDEVALGAASSVVWDMDNCLCAANESAKHTGLKVQPWDLQTTPQLNDRSGPTPSSLSKMAEAQNLMPNIKRWSKLNAPNAAWAAAAASVAVDVDAGSGSGSGGGAFEARFKSLEEENAKLRREMGEIATAVKGIGTNMITGFQQRIQGQQQGMAALLARTQGTDASVAMIGHAVAGIPGAPFEMPAPTAAAVTGYGGGGRMIADAAGADAAMNGAPNEVAEAVTETALVAATPQIDPHLGDAHYRHADSRLVGAPYPPAEAAAPATATTTTHIGAPMCRSTVADWVMVNCQLARRPRSKRGSNG